MSSTLDTLAATAPAARSASSGTRAARCRRPRASRSRRAGWTTSSRPTRSPSPRCARSADDSVRESHFDHTQADSFRQGGNIPPIWTRSRGSDVRLIGLSWAHQYQAIVALPGSGHRRRRKGCAAAASGIARRVNDQIDFWHATSLRGFDSTLRHVGLVARRRRDRGPAGRRALPAPGFSAASGVAQRLAVRRLQQPPAPARRGARADPRRGRRDLRRAAAAAPTSRRSSASTWCSTSRAPTTSRSRSTTSRRPR